MAIVNLIRYSNRLTNPIYDSANIAFADISNQENSPTGKAFRMVSLGDASPPYFQYFAQAGIPEYKPSTQFTASFFIKAETWTEPVNLVLQSSDGAGVFVSYDPLAGTVSNFTYIAGGSAGPWTNGGVGLTNGINDWKQVVVAGFTNGTVGLQLRVALNAGVAHAPLGQSLKIGGLTLYQGTSYDFIQTTSAPRGSDFLPVFSFMKHRTATRYPQNSTSIQLGSGYVFAARPTSPPQRIFILTFDGMKWVTDSTDTIDPYTDADTNIAALEAFYNQVQLYGSFTYNHPMLGPLTVKFFKPLEIPAGEKGGTGTVLNLQLELVEQL